MATQTSFKKSINNIKKKLRLIQKKSSKIDYWFLRYSLNWIKNRAITLLNQRTNGYNSSNAREWQITIYGNEGKLENQDMNSGAIEFGIGTIGQFNINDKAKNDPRLVAQENNYIYNQSSKFKDSNMGWTFMLPDGRYIYTQGYGGKSFLFDAFIEYLSKKKYNEFYQKAFDKIMKNIVKSK